MNRQAPLHSITASATPGTLDTVVSDGVPVVGAVRRIQSLIAFGYPPGYLRRHLRISPITWRRLLGHPPRTAYTTISTALDAQIAAIWSHLQMTPGPSDRARHVGKQAGWPVPFMWDEHAINNPAATPINCPYTKSRETIRTRRRDRVEQVADATQRGLSLDQIAKELNVTQRTVVRDRDEARRLGLLNHWLQAS